MASVLHPSTGMILEPPRYNSEQTRKAYMSVVGDEVRDRHARVRDLPQWELDQEEEQDNALYTQVATDKKGRAQDLTGHVAATHKHCARFYMMGIGRSRCLQGRASTRGELAPRRMGNVRARRCRSRSWRWNAAARIRATRATIRCVLQPWTFRSQRYARLSSQCVDI